MKSLPLPAHAPYLHPCRQNLPLLTHVPYLHPCRQRLPLPAHSPYLHPCRQNFINLFSISLLSAALITPSVRAEISANVAIQSDYVWRGISQNSEDPSIQGGFDYSNQSGFYAGTWGASVDFSGPESTEFDVYAGWKTEFESGLGLDVGLIEYTYHGQDSASDSNFTEYYFGLNYAGFGVTYSIGDEFDDNIEISYGYDFEAVSLGATYGDYDSYNYYQFGISGDVEGVELDLSYWGTNVDDVMEADSRVVFTLSKSF